MAQLVSLALPSAGRSARRQRRPTRGKAWIESRRPSPNRKAANCYELGGRTPPSLLLGRSSCWLARQSACADHAQQCARPEQVASTFWLDQHSQKKYIRFRHHDAHCLRLPSSLLRLRCRARQGGVARCQMTCCHLQGWSPLLLAEGILQTLLA